MTLWKQLCEVIDHSDKRNSGAALINEVRTLANDRGCAEDEIILGLLVQALKLNRHSEQTHRCWESLSQREKQVAALVCSGLTGRQTAAYLVLSPETIKTHVRHILRKFNLNSRRDLRNLLAEWDFSHWVAQRDLMVVADTTADYRCSGQDIYYPAGDKCSYCE